MVKLKTWAGSSKDLLIGKISCDYDGCYCSNLVAPNSYAKILYLLLGLSDELKWCLAACYGTSEKLREPIKYEPSLSIQVS